MSVLPLSTPRFHFRGVLHCLDVFERELERYEREGGNGNPYIIFVMGDRGFRDLKNSQEKLLIKSIVEMETAIHATAAAAFSDSILLWTSQFQDHRLIHTSTSTVRGSSGKNKKPDSAWKPAILQHGRDPKWPSMALEAKWSERRAKLEQDMRFWIEGSGGQVKIALTISVYTRGRIVIEKWAMDNNKTIFTEQKMTIVRSPAPKCPRITGQLTLPFEDVFLKTKKSGETDFVLSHSQLERIAADIWDVQYTEIGRRS
ncbi:unnamed protein product [Penicillium pancosmium]